MLSATEMDSPCQGYMKKLRCAPFAFAEKGGGQKKSAHGHIKKLAAKKAAKRSAKPARCISRVHKQLELCQVGQSCKPDYQEPGHADFLKTGGVLGRAGRKIEQDYGYRFKEEAKVRRLGRYQA